MGTMDKPLSTPMDKNKQREVVQALIEFLPKSSVLFELEAVKPYECDALPAYRQLPMVVAIPENEHEVQAILRTCHRLGVIVVARGAGTGLSGGAMPCDQCVLLSLAKMMRIKSIDPHARTATVEPGVRNLAISEAAAVHNLYYAPDPSSQIACSIGGNVAENSGGMHCLKYGLTVHNILKLRAYTQEGELLEIGGEGLDSAGYDLLALMTGSEGLLAVITEVCVKLLPKPQRAQCVLAAFDDVTKAATAVGNIIAAGIIPAGLEMMDQLTTRAVEPFAQAGYPLDAKAILLCESDGAHEEVEDEIKRISAIMHDSGATEVRVSQDEAQRLRFWIGRKSAFPAAGRISADYYCMDGTIPKRALALVLKKIEDLSIEYNLRCMNVFHAGDGNLHPLILYDANEPGELERTEAFGEKILKLCIDVGGTITGEHGVGVEKLDSMCDQFASAELHVFHQIKKAFDPLGRLNPGKAVPSLHRCAEMGRMRVHSGQERFPDIPRF